jgi:hypothetical protein
MMASKVAHDRGPIRRDGDQVAMTHPAVAIEVRGWLKIESHASFEHIGGERVDPRSSVCVSRSKSYPVPCSTLECIAKAMSFHNGAHSVIHLPPAHAWVYRIKPGCACLADCRTYFLVPV